MLEDWIEFSKSLIPIKKKHRIDNTRKLSFGINYSYFNPILDLHGYNLEEAYNATKEHIIRGKQNKFKYVQIITGKSGEIRKEFPIWMDKIPHKNLEILNGGGAFKVFL